MSKDGAAWSSCVEKSENMHEFRIRVGKGTCPSVPVFRFISLYGVALCGHFKLHSGFAKSQLLGTCHSFCYTTSTRDDELFLWDLCDAQCGLLDEVGV